MRTESALSASHDSLMLKSSPEGLKIVARVWEIICKFWPGTGRLGGSTLRAEANAGSNGRFYGHWSQSS